MKRKSQKAMALLTVTALSISSVFTMPASAKSAKPKLSKKRITMWAGTKKKVTIKKCKSSKKSGVEKWQKIGCYPEEKDEKVSSVSCQKSRESYGDSEGKSRMENV